MNKTKTHSRLGNARLIISNPLIIGHILAIFTIVIQSGRLSATKALLSDFTPMQILLITLLIAYIFFLPFGKRIGFVSLKKELLFVIAGLLGTSLYFFTTNLALQYTSASNASLLLPCNVIITAILGFVVLRRKLSLYAIFGFLVAFSGIFLVVFGKDMLHLSSINIVGIEVFGDMLCLLSALFWSVYTLIIEKIFKEFKGESFISITRRIFFYGVICNFLFVLRDSTPLDTQILSHIAYGYNAFNLLFLGVMIFGISFLSWNLALKNLGALKASSYFYIAPILSVMVANITLGEQLSAYIVIGGLLTLLGAFLSQR